MEDKIALRLDETLDNFIAWLNSEDAIRYRRVICNYGLMSVSDDTGLDELERSSSKGFMSTGRRAYVQRLKQFGPAISCNWGEIQYYFSPLKKGMIVTLVWTRETAGAVWDLLKKIAFYWPETSKTITAWQSSSAGQLARETALYEAWWQSPEVRRIRLLAQIAYRAAAEKGWETMSAEERQAHEEAFSAWSRLQEMRQEKMVSFPDDDTDASVGDDIEVRQSPPGAPSNEQYDQAFTFIESGEKTKAEAWKWYCEQTGIHTNNSQVRHAFDQAIRRRLKGI